MLTQFKPVYLTLFYGGLVLFSEIKAFFIKSLSVVVTLSDLAY